MCNFIMMGILLVIAYTGMTGQERREGDSHSYTQDYSKYSRRTRVRTASRLASLPVFPPCPADGRAIWKQLAARTAGSSRGSPTE